MIKLELHDVEVEYIAAALTVQKYDMFQEMNCGPQEKKLFQAMLYNATRITELLIRIKMQLTPEAKLKLVKLEEHAAESYNDERINRAIKLTNELIERLYRHKEKEM